MRSTRSDQILAKSAQRESISEWTIDIYITIKVQTNHLRRSRSLSKTFKDMSGDLPFGADRRDRILKPASKFPDPRDGLAESGLNLSLYRNKIYISVYTLSCKIVLRGGYKVY